MSRPGSQSSCLDENKVLAFLEGGLSRETIAEVEGHLATCDACREMVELSAPAVLTVQAGSIVPRALPATNAARSEFGRGATVGRYVVLGPVGRGAMGEVYAAFDPELNRKVALKLLHGDRESQEGRARLLREAQSIAKLQHPNVVVVHDAGAIGDHVFIAMEFVEGLTVRAWLKQQKRSRPEIMEIFLAAGRGLAAAHAAGMVHRDFKPDNVMVSHDGHVRVMDFGLARLMEGDLVESTPPTPSTVESELLRSRPSVKLTQTGAVMGTPAYMAPEQFSVAPADARTDQFSFCVALYEALYGQRPFEGDTFGMLMKSVTAGRVSAPPAKSGVPGWLRRVLLRGLAAPADARFPSMKALLVALQTDPTVRARRVAIALALVACVAAGIGVARRGAGAQRALCQGAGSRWADVWERGVASSARKDAIHRAFLATGTDYAERAFTGTARLLDGYVERWSVMYADACEATNVRGEQSDQVLDLRMGCLQERLAGARALTDVLMNADATSVENAVSAASALPLLDRCGDVAALRAVVKPPDDDARKRVEALGLERARLAALRDAGHCTEAGRLAESLIPKVRAVGYLPLISETLNAAGMLSDDCVAPEIGIERYRDAYVAAVVSRHDEAAAEAAISLTQLFADRSELPLPARQWLTVGTATLQRTGQSPRLEAWLLNAEVDVLQVEGRSADAIAAAEMAVTAVERLLGKETLEMAVAYNSLGTSLSIATRYEASLHAFGEARDVYTRLFGAQHPKVALVSVNEGEALNALHRYVEARARFQEALDIWTKAHTSPAFVAYALTGLGLATLGEGRPSDAVDALEEALRIRVSTHEGRERLGESRFALARALWSRPAEHPRALQLAREARSDYAQVKGGAAKVVAIDAWLLAPAASL